MSSQKKNDIIEVNGKRYDARTGSLLGSTQPKARTVKQPAPGIVMDGFSRKPTPKPSRSLTSATTAHKVHSQTEKSKTLMRSAVHKPAEKQIHAKAHAATQAKKQQKAPPHILPVSPQRALRAKHASQSNLISKFGRLSHLTTHTSVLPVKPAPGETPVIAAPSPPSQAVSHQANMFQHALEHATSHQQQKPKKLKAHHKVAKRLNVAPKVVSASAGTLAVLLIVGFFAYQNVPNLAMRVAAARAGMNASLPGYHPSGYGVKGAVQYSPGQVVITYGSHSDDREFKLTQSKSDWNNETLVNNFVALDRRPYQTYQDDNRIIYMYDGSNATWIEDGVWYQIEGQNSLNSDQLVRMASSL